MTIILLVFYFLGRGLLVNWQKIREYDFSFNYTYLVIAYIFSILSTLWFGVGWKKILHTLEPDKKISLKDSTRISVYSWMGRYIPGKVVPVVGRAYLARHFGFSKFNLYLSSVFFDVLSVFSGAVFVLIGFGIAGYGVVENGKIILFTLSVLAIVVILFFDSPLFYTLLNKLLRAIDREPVSTHRRIGVRGNTKLILYFIVNHIFRALGFIFLVISITSIDPEMFVGMASIFVLAGVVGVATLVMPAGLGVRDGILTLGLQFYLPLEIAILVALLARLWEMTSELFLLGTTFAFNKVFKQKKSSN